jgi:PEP-CTERM motif
MKFNTLSVAVLTALTFSTGGALAQTYNQITDPNAISSLPFNSLITFNSFDGLSSAVGPINVGTEIGQNILFTSTPVSTVGANNQDLGDNGLWGARGDIGRPSNGNENTLVSTPTGDGNFIASAFITRRGEFGFSFANPVSSVGAYFNQFQPFGTTNNRLDLLAYDAFGNTLATYNFTLNTDPSSYNEGSFPGIQSSTANIYGFGVANGTFVMDNLMIAAVPEPSFYALLSLGALFVGAAARRRRRKE